MGVRRGAASIYLEASHPDVEEFLLSKDLLKGDNREKLDCNIAIILDEVFMKNLKGGSEKEKEIFSNILELRMKFGSPYIMFKHHAQDADPIWYKENNLKTEHSQLCCLLGDELVVTSRGNIPIKDLVNKRVQIWDGCQWTYTTTFEERGQTNSLIKIVFSDGTELVVTPNHRMVDENWNFVQAQDIMLGFKNATHSKRYKIVTEISQVVLDEPVPVYCPSIHTTGVFALANGLMTGNSEIFLHSDKDHTYTCMLSSVNLDKWEEWKEYRYKDILSVPMIGTIMLDAVVEEYIQKGKEKIKKAEDRGEISGLEKAVRFTEKGRAIALGTLGLHSLYQSKMIPFESKKARELNIEVHKFVRDEAEKATKTLATDLEEPEWCKGYGRRNTHLCVSGDTKVLTDKGNIPIIDLVGKQVNIWNGSEWSSVKPFKTGDNRPIYRVSLSNGQKVDCTEDHRWLIKNNRHKKYPEIIETKELKVGDKLDKWELPVIDGEESFPYPYTSGFFTGDGSYKVSNNRQKNFNRKEIRLCGNNADKLPCLRKLEVKEGCLVRDMSFGKNKDMIGKRFSIPDEVADKFKVPSINCKYEDKMNWLAGLFDSDGSNEACISSNNRDFLIEVQEMCLSLGIPSKVVQGKFIYQDGGRNPCYNIIFSKDDLQSLNDFTIRVKFVKGNRNASHYVKVESVEYLNKQDTYCLTEPKNSTCLFNGIKTMQCAIAPTTTNSVLCNAGSPGIEPSIANYFVMTGAKGSFERKNKYLKPIVEKKFSNPDLIWSKIRENDGSIQNIEGFTKKEKEVFKTAYEINQMEVIRQAGDRQHYVDQGQSLNLFFSHDADAKYIIDTHLLADEVKLKSLYYLRSTSEMNNTSLTDSTFVLYTREDCIYCQKAKALLDSLSISYTAYEKPDGRVPVIYVDGERLDDGYTSLLEMFNNIKPSSVEADKNLKEPSCTGCEG